MKNFWKGFKKVLSKLESAKPKNARKSMPSSEYVEEMKKSDAKRKEYDKLLKKFRGEK